ncbi:MAG: ABC transporter ATP-binding protein [Chloroflexia bacterium]|nr:ABC transporter ATP-binding protein [Chloroflexia bacterium]
MNKTEQSSSKAGGESRSKPAVIQIEDVTKVYKMGQIEVHALRGVSLEIHQGEFLSIMGPSGSGKSTLMNILGCLDTPSAGVYLLDSRRVDDLNDNELSEIRNRKIGFVFQTFNLLARTTALRNVELPLIYSGQGLRGRRRQAAAALEAVGLGDRLQHKPNELSGGQQQRVAIARSLVNDPAIILADEPTGNLDSRSGAEIMTIFQRLNSERGITVVFVTHDHEIARHTRRILHLYDGRVVEEERIDHPIVALAGAVEQQSRLEEAL